jgi:mannosyltransferase
VAGSDYLPAMLERRRLAILGGLTLVAAVARFATLDVQSYHHDEAVTAGRILRPDLIGTLKMVEESERSPPLYYVLAWIWTKALGTGEIGLRSFSALVGTLTVPAGYLTGRALVGQAPSAARVGLLTAAFIALNPYLIWYSQEGRSYALMVLFATFALAFFAQSIRRPSPASLALWALASALSLLSHYFAIFLIAAQVVLLLWTYRDRLRSVAPAVAAVVLVGIALIPLARAQERDDRRNNFTEVPLSTRVGEVGLNYVASEEPDPLAGSGRVDAVQVLAGLGGGLLLLAAVALITARAPPDERKGAFLATGVAASVILVPILLAALGVDYLNPRNLIAGVVPLLAVAAIAFAGQRAGMAGRLLAGATCALFAVVVVAVDLSAEMQRKDWRQAAEAMGDTDKPRVIVTNNNGDDPLSYYLGADKLKGRGLAEATQVDEIDVVSTTFTVDPPHGFRVANEQGLAPILILTRLESQRPRVVTPDDLRKVIRERSAALLDYPG